MSRLEKAINKHDIDFVINLYPDYYKDFLKCYRAAWTEKLRKWILMVE